MSQPTWDPEKRRWLLDGEDATAPRRNRRRSVDVIDRPYADDEEDAADPSYRGWAAGSSLGAELTRVGFGARDPRAVDHDRDAREPARDGGWALLDPVRPDPLDRDTPADDRPAYRSDTPQLFHTGEFDRIWQDGLAGPARDVDHSHRDVHPDHDSFHDHARRDERGTRPAWREHDLRDERGAGRPAWREHDVRDDRPGRSGDLDAGGLHTSGIATSGLDTGGLDATGTGATGTEATGRRARAWSTDGGRPAPGRRAAPSAPAAGDRFSDRPGPERFSDRPGPERFSDRPGPERFSDRAVPERAPRPSPAPAASTTYPSDPDAGYEPEDRRDASRRRPHPGADGRGSRRDDLRDDRHLPPAAESYDSSDDVEDVYGDDRYGTDHGREARNGHGRRRSAGYDERFDAGPTPGRRSRDRYDVHRDVRGHDGAAAGWYGDDRAHDDHPAAAVPARRSRHGEGRDDVPAGLGPETFDADGYTVDGMSRDGYGRDGFDLRGFDRHGYDRDGFDREGFDRDGYHADEYVDEPGGDERGFDERGLDERAADERGFDQRGFGERGYDERAADERGYSERADDRGFDERGYSERAERGYDQRGYDEPADDGTGYDGSGHRETGHRDARYDETGYLETDHDRTDYDDSDYDDPAYDTVDEHDPYDGRDGYGYAPGHGPDGYRPGRRRAPDDDDDPSLPGPDRTLAGGELPAVEDEPQERPTRASRRAQRKGRRRWPWVVGAAAVAGAVAVPVTMTLLGSGDDSRSDDPPLLSAGTANLGATGTEQSAPSGDAAAQPASAQITYEVTGSGRASAITFGRGTAVAQVADATLPWKQDSPSANGESDYTLTAVSDGGGDISCRILAGGAVIAEDKADGAYAAVSCTGRR